ncbi:hypothetical protein PLICRDRAFT_382544 [Plicaturopsis crispa FD-325 SS-3]|nr:hypothetical protein PLICRDRAFT_382544 [Plicaturopsis crispa FD-325 SS-3]
MRPPMRSTRSFRTSPPLLLPQHEQQHKSENTSPPHMNKAPLTASISAQSNAGDTAADKKPRHRMTDAQLATLEALFKKSSHPSREEKKAVAVKLGLEPKTLTIWFQNKRQTIKKGRSVTPTARPGTTFVPFSSLSMSKAASFSVFVDPSSSQPASEPRSTLGTRVSSPAENTTLSASMDNRPSFATRSHRMASYRSPLAAVSRRENQPSSRMARHSKSSHKHHIPEASRSRSNSAASSEGQPHLHPQELWTRIVSSPPAHNLNMPSERNGSSSAYRDMASRTQRPHINRKKHSLDWVCDRQTKRLREDSTDDDEESDVDDVFRGVSRSFNHSPHVGNISPHVGNISPNISTGLELLSYTASCQTMVPEEILASQRDLTTDIICGAAMLVGLKRSERR